MTTPVVKLFFAGGAVGFTYYMVMRPYWFPNPYKTRAVQNIEDRFSAGGGTPNHTPGVATERGNASNTESRQEGPHKGPDSEHFKENISNQKSEPGVWPEKFYESNLNNPKGK